MFTFTSTITKQVSKDSTLVYFFPSIFTAHVNPLLPPQQNGGLMLVPCIFFGGGGAFFYFFVYNLSESSRSYFEADYRASEINIIFMIITYKIIYLELI